MSNESTTDQVSEIEERLPNPGRKEWTLMVYMSGENNLSADMVYSMHRLKEEAAKIGDVNLFVYFDGYAPSVPTMYCDFSDPNSEYQFYCADKIEDKLYHVKPQFDENSAAMRSLANFVDWCVNKVEHKVDGKSVFGRPANRYALILSGHSLGFQSVGLFKDEGADYYMSMRRLRWMLNRLTKPKHTLERLERERNATRNYLTDVTSRRWIENTTPVLGQEFDILGFDSCVMGMLEVGFQFRKVAKTLIASEGSIPSAGWTYAELLGSIASRASNAPTTEVAKEFVKGFIRVQDMNTVGGITVDMAAWDLTILENKISDPFHDFVYSLCECFADSDSRTFSQMRRLLTYVHWRCQSYMFEQNVDIGDLCSLLVEEIDLMRMEGSNLSDLRMDALADSCKVLRKAIREAILVHGFSAGRYQYSTGMSLFFPWSLVSYAVSKRPYEELDFIRDTLGGRLWNAFLNKFTGDISLRHAIKVGDDTPDGIVYKTYQISHEADGAVGRPSRGGMLYLSGTKIPEEPRDRIVDEVADGWTESGLKTSDDPSNRLPWDPTIRTSDDPRNRTPDDPTNRTSDDPSNRTSDDPSNRTSEDPRNRVSNASNLRIAEDATNRLIGLTDRIPENGYERLLSGGNSEFFQNFKDCKNIQMFWDISGISELEQSEIINGFDTSQFAQLGRAFTWRDE